MKLPKPIPILAAVQAMIDAALKDNVEIEVKKVKVVEEEPKEAMRVEKKKKVRKVFSSDGGETSGSDVGYLSLYRLIVLEGGKR